MLNATLKHSGPALRAFNGPLTQLPLRFLSPLAARRLFIIGRGEMLHYDLPSSLHTVNDLQMRCRWALHGSRLVVNDRFALFARQVGAAL